VRLNFFFNNTYKLHYNNEMEQFTSRCQMFLFVLAICVDVTMINCHFNPFMDSEYFSIDWAGRDSSEDVSSADCLDLH